MVLLLSVRWMGDLVRFGWHPGCPWLHAHASPPFQWGDLSSCIHPMPCHTVDGPSMPRPQPSDPTMGNPPSPDPSPCTDEEQHSSASPPHPFPSPGTSLRANRGTRTACDEDTAWGTIAVAGDRIDRSPSPFPSDGPPRSLVSIRRPPPPSLPRPPSVPSPYVRRLVSGSIGPSFPFRKGR